MKINRFTLLMGATLALTAPLCMAQANDEEAIKSLLSAETKAYYDRNANAWESGWLHDAKVSRTMIADNSYYTAAGWEKYGPGMIDRLRKSADKPIPVQVNIDNYLIRMGTDMAWVEYDQSTQFPDYGNLKRFSREQRLLVKQNGQWKVAHQITVDPDTFKPDPQYIEANLNANGYHLLQAKKVNEAIEVFKTVVKLFPQSANAYDSLGEAYAEAGEKALAIQNYEQSIKLDPKNEAGKATLAKLKGK